MIIELFRLRFWLIIAVLFFLNSFALQAKVRLPALISNGMVLQRNQPLVIWGWADSKEEISLAFNGRNYHAVTGNDRKWKITLPAQKAGGPFQMTISGENQILLTDILIGEVWLCSGQSNMEFIMRKASSKYGKEISESKNQMIRQFMVKRTWSFSIQDTLTHDSWKTADANNVLDFTAVGYFFAKSLYEKYQVPIGLINSSYGGTPVESWTSEAGLKVFPEILSQIEAFKSPDKVNQILKSDQDKVANWYKKVQNTDEGLRQPKGQNWHANQIDFRDWKEMTMPGFFEDQQIDVDGIVWLKKEIILSDNLAGATAILDLGNITDEDITYVNGTIVGKTSSKHLARSYAVPAGLLVAGKNIITVRVLNKEKQGGFVKDKLYQLQVGKYKVSLSGTWKYRIGTNVPPLVTAALKQFSREPTVLFNSMIAPLIPYRIRGVIWYQGENNVGAAQKYRTLFPALISDWRNQWKQGDFPFLYVQLANFLKEDANPEDSSWALLRESQTKTLKLANTGMAVIHDIGEWNDIHPLNKKDVGDRLALIAQKVAYLDQKTIYSGPVYQTSAIEGSQIVVSFTSIGTGLMAKNGAELKHFAIAGADKKFVWAKAKIIDNTVVVHSDAVKNPKFVRYAWANNPVAANLYNKEGLPASSFRTDQ